MLIPDSVKIGAHTYKVILCDWREEENPDGQLSDVDGAIYINKNLQRSAQECTFIHESLHGMNSTLNHEVLDSLAEQIYQFLSDNSLLR